MALSRQRKGSWSTLFPQQNKNLLGAAWSTRASFRTHFKDTEKPRLKTKPKQNANLLGGGRHGEIAQSSAHASLSKDPEFRVNIKKFKT